MTCLEARVRNFAQWLERTMEVQQRDASHGMAHFERVRLGAMRIAAATQPLTDEESLILQLAALSHDVLDHKYLTAEDGVTSAAALKSALQEALGALAVLTPRQVADVCLVAENVSLSKERAGQLQVEALTHRNLLHVRDFVSDADKLDALGIGGLQRLAQYQAHLFRGMGSPKALACHLSAEFLRTMAEEHLLHREAYLRSPIARVDGARLMTEMTCILMSDVALEKLIENVLVQDLVVRPVKGECPVLEVVSS